MIEFEKLKMRVKLIETKVPHNKERLVEFLT